MDGYAITDGVLLRPEADVLDVEEEHGVLRNLFDGLNLANSKTTFHHLALSEEHYVAEKWDDSIANSRKFLESVLREVASSFGKKSSSQALSDRALESPFKVRDYLEREGLLESREKEAVAKVYGLLSHTGGHPYMAQSDQARLLRHLALTFSQFAMLRLKGFIASANQTAA